MMTILFWASFGTLLYIYFGYPAAVTLLARFFGKEPARKEISPSVSLVIPAFDEEVHIRQKIENSLLLRYPKEKMEIVVANDGSTDGTEKIAREFENRGVRLFSMERNIGKAAMLDRVVPQLAGEIVVFSDASSQLDPDALGKLVRSFNDPAVGCVCGQYKMGGSGDLRGEGEGLYWKYETFIKRQESRLHSILGAHGALYAIRKGLYSPLGESAVNDDYLVPMRIVAAGHRAVYEPEALVFEREIVSIKGEFSRRRRIAVGNCQQIAELKEMISPRYGWIAFSFFSHKILRTLAPLFMAGMLAGSFFLPALLGAIALALQGLFYLSAYAGFLCQRKGWSVRILSAPLYFCLGNLAMLAGLIRYCFQGNKLVWERSR